MLSTCTFIPTMLKWTPENRKNKIKLSETEVGGGGGARERREQNIAKPPNCT